MKKLFSMLLAIWVSSAFADTQLAVTKVETQQRYPWNGLVDVIVTIQGTAGAVAEADCSFAATNSATQVGIPVVHIIRNGDDSGSGSVWTRKFIWDAKADVGAMKIDDVALTVDFKSLGGVQLWENGPYWAKRNVGATQPEECGYYFWWGDTVGYKRNANNNGWISAKDSTSFSFSSGNCQTDGKDSSLLQSDGYIDATGNLVSAHDAATAHHGAPWRMPADAEIATLVRKCTFSWTTRNGVKGYLVTGKEAYSSKSIFLPAAGDGLGSDLNYLGSYGNYWSSTSDSDHSDSAWFLDFGSSYIYQSLSNRSFGYPVRPIRGGRPKWRYWRSDNSLVIGLPDIVLLHS